MELHQAATAVHCCPSARVDLLYMEKVLSCNEISKAVLVLSLSKLVQRTMHRVI
jgi:hypothetical protein